LPVKLGSMGPGILTLVVDEVRCGKGWSGKTFDLFDRPMGIVHVGGFWDDIGKLEIRHLVYNISRYRHMVSFSARLTQKIKLCDVR
jgi:hypothetical protein